MRVGIVGAGICGLSTARTLRAAGHETVLFEKNKRVGGRVATFSQDGYTWDTGATSIAPRGKSLETLMLQELDTRDLVKIEKPIHIHSALRISAGDRRVQAIKYTYRTGIATLAKLLAEGLEVRLETQVEAIARHDGGFEILNEPFDRVVLTAPTPRTAALLWSLEESRPLASVFYRSCINVALGYAHELPPVSYHALLDPEQRHPLTWLSLESVKSPDRAPEGGCALCIQYSPEFSLDSYQQPDDQLISTACFFVSKLYGPEFQTPASATVKRWKYSQPESIGSLDEANPPGTGIYIASDALLGGHIEDAFEVGRLVAEKILSEAT